MRRPPLAQRVVTAAIAALACAGAGAPAASANQPPSAPATTSVALLAADQARPDGVLTWSASADPDGSAVAYVVEHAAGDALPFVQLPAQDATSVTITGLLRAATHRFRVVAVDASGERSAPAPEATLRVPRLVPTLRLLQDAPSAAPLGCTRACTRETLTGVSLQVQSGPAAANAGRRFTVDLLHRPPGARRLRAAGRLAGELDAEGRAGLPLAPTMLRHHPGLWCLRAKLPRTAERLAARSPLSCLRLRPPVTIGWAGDIVLGSEYGSPPDRGMHVFDGVRSLLRSPDLMIGNYEGVLSAGGGSRRCSGGPLCFIFRAPPSRARALRHAGFDVMNLANNHALDYGSSGRRDTVRALQGAGLGAAGLPGHVLVRRVHDTRIAIVGMSPYPGTTSMRRLDDVRALVRAARRRADVVVVCMHAGLEGAAGAHVPRGADYGTHTRAATHAAIDAGADLVLGSGPHVVRGVERRAGRFIVYSTGNFAGWRNFALGGPSSQSGVVQVTLDHHGRARGARWHGVVLVGPGLPVRDRSGSVVRRVRELSRADFGSAGARFTRSGRFA